MSSTVLQFGKHKGKRLDQVPEDYLRWLVGEQEKTLAEYKAEISRREYAAEADLTWEQKIVQAGFRALATKHHPDRGGSKADMQKVNAAYESLRTKVR